MKYTLLLPFIFLCMLSGFGQSITLSDAPEDILNGTYFFSGNYLGKGDFLKPSGEQGIYWNGSQWRVQVHGHDVYFHPAESDNPPSTGWLNVDNQLLGNLSLSGHVDKYAMENVMIVHDNSSPALVWTTNKEFKCKSYVVETSLDGMMWQKIGELEGQGNTLTTHHYRYPLRDLAPGFIHFRIKQLNEDGTANISHQCMMPNQARPVTFFED